MRSLNTYMFSKVLSNAYYGQDTGLDIAENHSFKASYFLNFLFTFSKTHTNLTYICTKYEALVGVANGHRFSQQLSLEGETSFLTLWIWPDLETCSASQDVAEEIPHD